MNEERNTGTLRLEYELQGGRLHVAMPECGGFSIVLTIPPGTREHDLEAWAGLAAVPLLNKLGGLIEAWPYEVREALRTVTGYVIKQQEASR